MPRTLRREELQTRLDALFRNSGDVALNLLRDQARQIAPMLGLAAEMVDLEALIGTLLGTREAQLVSEPGRARGRGEPFDPRRIGRLELLHDDLRRRAPQPARPLPLGDEAARNQAFFEAYFSNFIEGTEFEVDEAVDIVFRGVIPATRPADAHDILGTFAVVSSAAEMGRLPADHSGFEDLLRHRHETVMAGRPGKQPRTFKTAANRAGSTSFAHSDDVRGTLRRGFEIYRRLNEPLDRAIFMMFLIAEIHPFADGNGRVSRIMMNAELAAAGEARIIIPTIYRTNYLSALRALSLNDVADPLIRTLDFAQRYVRAIPWDEFGRALRVLDRTGAFVPPDEADERGVRLRIPTAADAAEM